MPVHVCICVSRWTVQLLMVTADYVSNNSFPITMGGEVSSGVTALHNDQLEFVCEHVERWCVQSCVKPGEESFKTL